ncbi:MAG: hypothetical protein HQL58_02800 [Magnetococcales bacterium]|nr:hypothetical protein [Magnetococcales bacterium]
MMIRLISLVMMMLTLAACAPVGSMKPQPTGQETLPELLDYLSDGGGWSSSHDTALQLILERHGSQPATQQLLGDMVTCRSHCPYQDKVVAGVLRYRQRQLTERVVDWLDELRLRLRNGMAWSGNESAQYRTLLGRLLRSSDVPVVRDRFIDELLQPDPSTYGSLLLGINLTVFSDVADDPLFAAQVAMQPRWPDLLRQVALRYPFPEQQPSSCHPAAALVGAAFRANQQQLAQNKTPSIQDYHLASMIAWRTQALPVLVQFYQNRPETFHYTIAGQPCFNRYAAAIADSFDPDYLLERKKSGVSFQSGDGYQIIGKRIGWMRQHSQPGSQLWNTVEELMARMHADPIPMERNWSAQEVRIVSGPENRDRFEPHDRQYIFRDNLSHRYNGTLLLNSSASGIPCQGPGKLYAGFIEDISTALFTVEEKTARPDTTSRARWQLDHPLVFEFMFCEPTPSQ